MLEKSLADIPASWVKVDFDPATIMRATMDFYADLELPLIPVWGTKDGVCRCPEGKCDSAGKHPITSLVPQGIKNASLETRDFRRWLKRHPDMNIGVATEGITVIDFDSPEAHRQFHKRFKVTPTLTIRTGRGAQEYYEGETRSRIGIAEKTDIKSGATSYVVGAGSLHRNGRRYIILNDRPLAPLPDVVRAWIETDEGVDGDNADDSNGYLVRQSKRNKTLFDHLCMLRSKGCSKEQLLPLAQAFNASILRPPLGSGEVRVTVRSVLRYDRNPRSGDRGQSQFPDGVLPEMLSFTKVKDEVIDWLWYPYIARGTLGLLDGLPGEGKSQFLCWLAAKLSIGERLPNGDKLPPINTFLLNLEDLAGAVIKKRLQANGADLDRIFIQDKRFQLDDEMTDWLDQKAEQLKPALIILDPIQAFITSDVDSNNNVSVRRFMNRLAEIAERHHCAIISVRHFGKTKHDRAMQNGIGSTDFVGIARTQLGLARRDDDKTGFVVMQMKTNFATADAMMFEMSEADGRKGDQPRITFEAFAKIDPDDYLAPDKSKRGPDANEREDAKVFLSEFLAEGPQKLKTIKAQAEARGVSLSTLNRARVDLDIVTYKDGTLQFWKLPNG